MTRWINVFGALAVMTCGCNGIVIDPLNPDAPPQDSGDPGTPDAPSPDGDDPGTPNALAMHMSQLQPLLDDNVVHLPGVPAFPSDALVLFFASEAQSCAEPEIPLELEMDPALCESNAFWQTVLILPPELVQPGVVDLGNTAIYKYWAATLTSCGGGYAQSPSMPGSLEIESVDGASVSVKLQLESPSDDVEDPTGDYMASFCQ